jgi:hypothetical protein
MDMGPTIKKEHEPEILCLKAERVEVWCGDLYSLRV